MPNLTMLFHALTRFWTDKRGTLYLFELYYPTDPTPQHQHSPTVRGCKVQRLEAPGPATHEADEHDVHGQCLHTLLMSKVPMP